MNALPSNIQQPNAGIATGNPQPLPTQQPKQQPQKFDMSQFPDLATALHAMKVVQDEKNKQVQQGLQAGAQAQQQPPVIQQINAALQKLAAERAPQPQAGGVDQLPTGLGEGYAGGGIVAFDDGGNVKGDGEDEGFWLNFLSGLQGLAGATSDYRPKQPFKDVDDRSKRPSLQGLAAAADAASPTAEDIRKHQVGFAGSTPVAPNTDTSGSRREVVSTGIKTPANTEQSDYMTKMKALALKGADMDVDARNAVLDAKYKEMLGADAILEEQRKRAEGIQALMEQQRDARSPMQQWLSGFAKASPAGGLGLAAANAADVYGAAQQGWADKDLANKIAVGKMLDDISKQKLSTNERLVQASQKGLGDLMQQQSGALTAGTHLAGVEESARARMQDAMLRHAELAQRVQQGKDDKDMATLALLEKSAEDAGNKRAALDQKQIENLSDAEIGRRAIAYKLEALRTNATYNDLLKKHKITPISVPAPATDQQAAAVAEMARRGIK